MYKFQGQTTSINKNNVNKKHSNRDEYKQRPLSNHWELEISHTIISAANNSPFNLYDNNVDPRYSNSETTENKGLNDMYIETPHTLGESYHQYDEPVKSRHSVYGNKEKDHSTNSTMFNANTFQHMDVTENDWHIYNEREFGENKDLDPLNNTLNNNSKKQVTNNTFFLSNQMFAKSYGLNRKDNADYDEEHIHVSKRLTEINPKSKEDSVHSDMIEVDIEHVDLLPSYETGDNLKQPDLKKRIKVNPSRIEAVTQEQEIRDGGRLNNNSIKENIDLSTYNVIKDVKLREIIKINFCLKRHIYCNMIGRIT